jgi:hypothetical protein
MKAPILCLGFCLNKLYWNNEMVYLLWQSSPFDQNKKLPKSYEYFTVDSFAQSFSWNKLYWNNVIAYLLWQSYEYIFPLTNVLLFTSGGHILLLHYKIGYKWCLPTRPEIKNTRQEDFIYKIT